MGMEEVGDGRRLASNGNELRVLDGGGCQLRLAVHREDVAAPAGAFIRYSLGLGTGLSSKSSSMSFCVIF